MPTIRELITSLTLIAESVPSDTKIYFAPKDTGNLLSPNVQALVQHITAGNCVVMTNATYDEFTKSTGLKSNDIVDLRKGKKH